MISKLTDKIKKGFRVGHNFPIRISAVIQVNSEITAFSLARDDIRLMDEEEKNWAIKGTNHVEVPIPNLSPIRLEITINSRWGIKNKIFIHEL